MDTLLWGILWDCYSIYITPFQYSCQILADVLTTGRGCIQVKVAQPHSFSNAYQEELQYIYTS